MHKHGLSFDLDWCWSVAAKHSSHQTETLPLFDPRLLVDRKLTIAAASSCHLETKCSLLLSRTLSFPTWSLRVRRNILWSSALIWWIRATGSSWMTQTRLSTLTWLSICRTRWDFFPAFYFFEHFMSHSLYKILDLPLNMSTLKLHSSSSSCWKRSLFWYNSSMLLFFLPFLVTADFNSRFLSVNDTISGSLVFFNLDYINLVVTDSLDILVPLQQRMKLLIL